MVGVKQKKESYNSVLLKSIDFSTVQKKACHCLRLEQLASMGFSSFLFWVEDRERVDSKSFILL